MAAAIGALEGLGVGLAMREAEKADATGLRAGVDVEAAVGFEVGFGVGFGVALGVGVGVGFGVGFGVGLGVGEGGGGDGGGGAVTITRAGDTVASVTERAPLPVPLVAEKLYVQVPAGRVRLAMKTAPAW